jgi:hypothetical protein
VGRSNGTSKMVGDGLREILIRNREHELAPWTLDAADGFLSALKAGAEVVVDSATLYLALMHAGQSAPQFALPQLGGMLGGKEHMWLIGADGEVTPWTVEDSVMQGIAERDPRYDADPENHC